MWRGIAKGYERTIPVAAALIPFGVAYGAIADRAMTFWQAILMSLVVFAGTAQFIAASLLVQGAPYVAILLTGLLINARMVLMSAALAPHLRHAPTWVKYVAAHVLTDESFAVSVAEYEGGGRDPYFPIGSGLAIYSFWQTSTLIGLIFGAGIPSGMGLDFALPASLIGLLFLLVRDRATAIVACLGAALSVVARPIVSDTWSTMFATLVAASLGVVWKRWRSRS